jgi:glycosyltransferase involved in cell wall biosynthesis
MAKSHRKKIIFISPVPYEGAGCRFRIWQYLPYLKERQIDGFISPFMSSYFFKIVYKDKGSIRKIFFFMLGLLRRLADIMSIFRYDAVYVYRESLPLGPVIFEKLVHLLGKPLIFDFDDAVFLPNSSPNNKLVKLFRNNNNASKIISLSKEVIAGNMFLKEYAQRFNPNVTVIPTPVDTEYFCPAPHTRQREKVIVGWMGSPTTEQYLYPLEPVFKQLFLKFKDKLVFRIIGASGQKNSNAMFEYRDWQIEREADDLRDFDIGIMPLNDDLWCRGKCGFKALLYMSTGVACVCSSVGANKEIIDDGVDGLLAKNLNEWFEKLSSLIEDHDLRRKIGIKAREKVILRYSLNVNAPLFCDLVEKVCSPAEVEKA